ncbi:MAG: 50S ribosomal protein L11 methyltransferase [Desulfobacula sp.]|nr:50S ribosomal protein L11 methyltransferase [Desulfobacula sp.]
MKNPYGKLFIYYFEGVPYISKELEARPTFFGSWVDDEVAFLFFSVPSKTRAVQIEKDNAHVRLIDTYEMTGEQWHGDKIEPYYINDLCICPPWEIPGVNKGEKRILLDPGVVFGTGRHQTTEDCLFLIHRLCTQNNIDSVLDIGTGTGLLSLGAAVLGCTTVMACDFNYLAVKTTRNNILINHVEDQVVAFQAKGEEMMSLACDLLVANTHYDVLQHIIESPYLMDKKWFILSGLLNSEAKKIMDSLSEKNVHIVERRCPDGVWNTIVGKVLKKAEPVSTLP